MKFEQIMVIVATLVGAVTTIFAQDLRLLALRYLGKGSSVEAEAPAVRRGGSRSKRHWLLASMIILFGIPLFLAAKYLTRGDTLIEPDASTTVTDVETAPTDTASAREQQPKPQVVVPRSVPDRFDWTKFRGKLPIWYRIGRDNQQPVYVDAASVELPSEDTRRFWTVVVPSPQKHAKAAAAGVSYIKTVQHVDCRRNTIRTGRSELYERDGTHIISYSEAETAATEGGKEREAVPGSTEQAITRFVCEGPNEDTAEVLRGGGLAEFLASSSS